MLKDTYSLSKSFVNIFRLLRSISWIYFYVDFNSTHCFSNCAISISNIFKNVKLFMQFLNMYKCISKHQLCFLNQNSNSSYITIERRPTIVALKNIMFSAKSIILMNKLIYLKGVLSFSNIFVLINVALTVLEKNNMVVDWSDYSENTHRRFNNSYFSIHRAYL